MKDSSAPNKHIHEFLSYFLTLTHAPKYAVLIDGPWGIGKTHLIKRILKEVCTGESRYIYVSLNGLSSIDDIDNELFKSLYPALAKKGMKIAGRLATAVGRAFKFDPNLDVGDVLSKFGKGIYVFDDLERFEGSISKALGYINQFVEHDDGKVVVVANEREIKDTAYASRREKLIGKTLAMQSEHLTALTSFIGNLTDAACRGFLSSRLDELTSLCVQSDLNNLRIFQQTIWDFERIFRTLSATHRAHDRAMLELMRLFFSLSFEVRSGKLPGSDLTNRTDKLIAGNMSKDPTTKPPLNQAQSRYPNLDLCSNIIPDELLVELLIKGVVDQTKIQSTLNTGPYFSIPSAEPYWRTICYWEERKEADVEAAFDTLERRFRDREPTSTGEMLHVFGLRLFFAERRAPKTSRDAIVQECKDYIQSMFELGRIEPLPLDGEVEFRHGYQHIGFYLQESAEFQTLKSCLQSFREKAREATYPALASELLDEMENDPDLFLRRVCQVRDNKDHRFIYVPILAHIAVPKFVDVFLNHDHAGQKTVMMALEIRYKYGGLGQSLLTEKAWLLSMRDELLGRAKMLSWLQEHRIERAIQHHIERYLS